MDFMIGPSAAAKAYRFFHIATQTVYGLVTSKTYQPRRRNFFDLPPELRLIIYNLYFADTSLAKSHPSQRSPRPIYAHPLMNASSRLRIDAAYPYIFLQLGMVRQLKCHEQRCWEKVHGFEKKHGRIRGVKVGEYRAIWESASAQTAERKKFAMRVLEGMRVSKQMGGFGGWDMSKLEDWLYGESWREYSHGAEEMELL